MAADEPTSAGWDAIDSACRAIYGDQPPRHVAYHPGRAFGSVLQGASAYRAHDHWHYVTGGLSNLFDDTGDDDGRSGWGYELTWRVRSGPDDGEAPGWPFSMLQSVAKWASGTPVLLEDGTRINMGAPVTGHPVSGGPDTSLTGAVLTTDPELGEIVTANGRVRFLQLVGYGPDEIAEALAEGSAGVLERTRLRDPLLVTDVASRPGAV